MIFFFILFSNALLNVLQNTKKHRLFLIAVFAASFLWKTVLYLTCLETKE